MRLALAAAVAAVVVALLVIAGGGSARAEVRDGRIRCEVFVEDASGNVHDIRAHDSADRAQAIQLSRDDPVEL
ncbi:MAG: hypothetical protein ACOC5M_03645, partial [Chloroflexota bacterium]